MSFPDYKSQSLLWDVVKLCREYLVITDAEGSIELINPAFESITGYNQNELKSKKPHTIVNIPHDASALKEALDKLQYGNIWEGNLHLQTKDGNAVEVNTRIYPVFDHRNKLTHYIAMGLDLTREKSLKRRLQEIQKMESLGTLANGIAHRFNNILASIMIQSEWIMMHKSDDRIQKASKHILEAVNMGKEFVSQIMSFSCKEEKKIRPIDITPIIKNAVKFIRSVCSKGITIKSDIPDYGHDVLADSEEINQLILNLINNAIQAMEAKKGILTVTLKKDFRNFNREIVTGEELKNCVIITISDTGTGIEESIQHRIFEPFFTTRSLAKASGMGLAVVHGILERHGGKIDFTSQPGSGTTFEVCFPILQIDESQRENKNLPCARKNEHVLLVDDELFITQVAQDMLSEIGYKLTTCNNPIKALKTIKENPDRYQLLITDLTMPEMTGLDLAASIREQNWEKPIILSTGFTQPVEWEKVKKTNIALVLKKPCSIKEVAFAVRRVLDGHLENTPISMQ